MAGSVRFDPFEDMARLQREVSRLFEDGLRAGGAEHASARTWVPAVDIFEGADEIVVRAELPGLKREDIDIELVGDTLTLKGERRFEDSPRRDTCVRVERAYGHFQRAFTLGIPVRQDAVKASYKDGILEIHLPKSDEAAPKKVHVTAE